MAKTKKEESKVYTFTSEKVVIEERPDTSTKTTDLILEVGKIYHVTVTDIPAFTGRLLGYDYKAQTLRFDKSKEFKSEIISVYIANMKYISGCGA